MNTKQNESGSFKSPGESDPDLSLEDTVKQKLRGLPVKSSTGVSGYNPYDAMPAPKRSKAPRKPTDLRKLSEWIRVQRQLKGSKEE